MKHQEHAIPQTDLARIAPRQRGAWIETTTWRRARNRPPCIAPRQRGAWIETLRSSRSTNSTRRASLPGNGERGLKPFSRSALTGDVSSIAPRQRGAWIETRCCNAGWNYRNRIAPRQRGAWIETPGRSSVVQHRRIASLPGNGERGLKQVIWPVPAVVFAASLPGNGERGLKPDHQWRLCISQQASLPGNGERGLKHFSFAAQPENRRSIAPRQRRAWIETQPTMRPNWSSSVHRSPATGSVD